MKIAHLILAHKDPEMLERLVKKLLHEDADIFIQLDKKADIRDFIHIENLGNTRFVANRVLTSWGNYSIITATLAAMEEILALKNEYSHINLLSGQDYVTKPIDTFHKFIAANPEKIFMHSLSIADHAWPDGEARFKQFNLGDLEIPGKHRLQKLANTFLPDRKAPQGLSMYGGSQWMTLTPACIQYVLDFINTHPREKRFFKFIFAIDEAFFQTILENSPFKSQIVNDNLRYIFLDKGKRTINYTMADADALANTDAFFARKFESPTSNEVLGYLDAITDTRVKVNSPDRKKASII